MPRYYFSHAKINTHHNSKKKNKIVTVTVTFPFCLMSTNVSTMQSCWMFGNRDAELQKAKKSWSKLLFDSMDMISCFREIFRMASAIQVFASATFRDTLLRWFASAVRFIFCWPSTVNFKGQPLSNLLNTLPRNTPSPQTCSELPRPEPCAVSKALGNSFKLVTWVS